LDECYGLGPNREIFEAALAYCDVVLPSADDMRVIYPGLAPADIAASNCFKRARRALF